MNKDNITILIVDDHPLLLSGLGLLLEREPDMEVRGLADTAPLALKLAVELRPDVILLDISLHHDSGLRILPELLQASPSSRVIMLTMHEDRQYLKEALAKGARGFLLKKGLDIDLMYAIRAVMHGEMFIHPSMMQEMFGGPREEASSPEEQLWRSLSQREQQVVLGVVRGFTSKEIAEQLLLSEKTVATYRARAMIKLGIESRAELVELVNRLQLPAT